VGLDEVREGSVVGPQRCFATVEETADQFTATRTVHGLVCAVVKRDDGVSAMAEAAHFGCSLIGVVESAVNHDASSLVGQ